MTKEEFVERYCKYMDSGGHKYDTWDLVADWSGYQEHPEEYQWLLEEGND